MTTDQPETDPEFTEDPEADLPPVRQLSWFPLAGAFAVVVLIVILTVTLAGGENRGAPNAPRVDGKGALLCPDNYEYDPAQRYWVPNKPIGVDAATSLVPDEEPSDVTICQYAPLADRTSAAELLKRGRHVLGGDLDKVRVSLTAAKVSRTPAGGRRDINTQAVYLVGLVFPEGTLWVSVGALTDGNGTVVATEELATTVSAAYRASRWP